MRNDTPSIDDPATDDRPHRPGADYPSGDYKAMKRAVELAETARSRASPNPWVGCVIAAGSSTFEGATMPPGGPHAEAVALSRAGPQAKGATLYSTLEPCSHQGRTSSCAEAIVAAGVSKVVVGIEDPDPQVGGKGLATLRQHGIEVTLGVARAEIEDQLAPYLKHRTTGRPWVVLKLASTLDGRIAAPDGSSKWITGPQAREDAHLLRAQSDAVLVGAGTVRRDDPRLTVRLGEPWGTAPLQGAGDGGQWPGSNTPMRVVLGRVPAKARALPALEAEGDLGKVLDDLGSRGVVQLLVEGGARVAHGFHSAGLIDRYVLYLAAAFVGGDDGTPMFAGPGAATIADIWRGSFVSVTPLGEDLRIEITARPQDLSAPSERDL